MRLSFIFLLCVTSCLGSPAEPEAQERITPVDTFSVRRLENWDRKYRFSGKVRNGQLSLLSFERGGQVDRVFVEEGQLVQKGARLAQLDRRKLQSSVRRTQAGLARAKAQYELTKRTDARVRRLAKEDFATEQRADEVRFGAEVAGQSVEELEAALSTLRIDLEKSVLRAPFSGRINRRFLDEGTVVSSGSPVLQLMSRKGKEVYVGVALSLFRALSLEQSVVVMVEKRSTEGKIVGLIDELDPKTQTAGVLIALPPDFEAIEGELATVQVATSVAKPGFWAPLSSLRPGLEGQWTVLRIKEGRADPVAVTVLHLQGSEALVQGPLQSGELIVRSGLNRLVPGQRITADGVKL